MGVLERSELVSHSEHCEEAYGALLTLRKADSGAGEEAFMDNLEAAEKEAQRLLVQEEAAMDGGILQDPRPRYPWEPWGLGGPMSGALIGENGAPRTGHMLGVGMVPMVGMRPAGVDWLLRNKVGTVVTAIGVAIGPTRVGMKMDDGAH